MCLDLCQHVCTLSRGAEVGVPEADEQNNPCTWAVIPHFVLIGIVKDQNAALLPLSKSWTNTNATWRLMLLVFNGSLFELSVFPNKGY